jgi:hypothetical protein
MLFDLFAVTLDEAEDWVRVEVQRVAQKHSLVLNRQLYQSRRQRFALVHNGAIVVELETLLTQRDRVQFQVALLDVSGTKSCLDFLQRLKEASGRDLSDLMQQVTDSWLRFASADHFAEKRRLKIPPSVMERKYRRMKELSEPARHLRDVQVQFKVKHLAERRARRLARVAEIRRGLPPIEEVEVNKRKRESGRACLSHDELIYRLAKAQEALELRKEHPGLTWPQTASAVGWCAQRDKSRVKLLQQDGCDRLKRADVTLLAEVAKFRGKERKEN